MHTLGFVFYISCKSVKEMNPKKCVKMIFWVYFTVFFYEFCRSFIKMYCRPYRQKILPSEIFVIFVILGEHFCFFKKRKFDEIFKNSIFFLFSVSEVNLYHKTMKVILNSIRESFFPRE